MQEETLRLVTEASTKEIYAYKDSVEYLGRATYEFADQDLRRMDAMLSETDGYLDALIRNAVAATAAQKGLAAATRGAGEGAAGAGAGLRNLNIAVQQASYGLGDFASTSGDLGAKLMSVSNNVQFVTAQMGPWGAAAGLAVVGVAALVKNYDALARAMQEKAPFPKAADELHQLNEEMERGKSRLEELRKLTELTKGEADEYARTLAQTADLEKKIGDERQRQADLKKLAERKDVGEEALGKERAEALQDSLGGAQDELTSNLAEAMRRAAARRQSQLISQLAAETDPAERRRLLEEHELRAKQAASTEANAANAREMLMQAMERGDKGAFDEIRKFMRASPDLFERDFKLAFEHASPEAMEFERKSEADLGRRGEAVKERDERAKKAEAEKKKAEKLAYTVEHDLAAGGATAAQEAAGAEAGKEGKKTAAAQTKAEAAARKRAAENLKLFADSGLQEQAEAFMTTALARGFTPAQAQAGMRRQVVGPGVTALAPGLSPADKTGVVERIASAATADFQKRAIQLQARGITGQEQALVILRQLDAEVARDGARLARVESGYADVARKIDARGRSMSARGR